MCVRGVFACKCKDPWSPEGKGGSELPNLPIILRSSVWAVCVLHSWAISLLTIPNPSTLQVAVCWVWWLIPVTSALGNQSQESGVQDQSHENPKTFIWLLTHPLRKCALFSVLCFPQTPLSLSIAVFGISGLELSTLGCVAPPHQRSPASCSRCWKHH